MTEKRKRELHRRWQIEKHTGNCDWRRKLTPEEALYLLLLDVEYVPGIQNLSFETLEFALQLDKVS